MIERGIGTVRVWSTLATLMLNVACGTNPVGTPNVDVRINELSSSNHDYQDENGDTDDWIELYNTSDESVDLAGYHVSDSANNRLKAVIADGLTIAGHGVLLLWADEQPAQGSNHLSLKLSSDGDGACLSDTAGYVLDCIEFSSIPKNDAGSEDTSLARFPDGTGSFKWCSQSSPEELNGERCLGESPQ